MNERARAVWARTRLHVWPQRYALVSLDPALLAEAAHLVGGSAASFAALVVERDEVSVAITQEAWMASPLRARRRAEDGPYRAITLDVEVDLDVSGYLAPAAVRLAAAGIAIVPQCAYWKDHLLVHDADIARATAVLQSLIAHCRQQ